MTGDVTLPGQGETVGERARERKREESSTTTGNAGKRIQFFVQDVSFVTGLGRASMGETLILCCVINTDGRREEILLHLFCQTGQ